MNDSTFPDIAALPVRVDRKTGAELVAKFYFPVSPRTLEAWPLMTRQVNGKATVATADLFAYARQKLDAAPPPRLGGRKPKVQQHQSAPRRSTSEADAQRKVAA